MSTDIKPGQVWAWEYDQAYPFTIVSLHDGEVEYHYGARKAGHTVYAALPERIREKATLVKDVDATPVPLDPSKVAITLKAGDYIEAESDGTKIGGPVSHVNENGFVSIQHPLELGYLPTAPLPDWSLLDPAQGEPYVGDRWTLRVAHGRYTLTDTVNEVIGELE